MGSIQIARNVNTSLEKKKKLSLLLLRGETILGVLDLMASASQNPVRLGVQNLKSVDIKGLVRIAYTVDFDHSKCMGRTTDINGPPPT